MADRLLHHDHLRFLPAAAVRADGAVHRDRAPPDGRPDRFRLQIRWCSWRHPLQHQRPAAGRREQQLARSPPGGADAGHGGHVLLHLPDAVPRAHALHHRRSRRDCHETGRRALLQPALLLPHHALPQLGRQPDSLQPDVVKVQAGLHQAVRAAAPTTGPLETRQRVAAPAGQRRRPHHRAAG